MSIKQQNRLKRKTQAHNASKVATNTSTDAKPGQPLAELLSVMKSVDTKSKEAKQNEESMVDSEGNLVWYNWLFRGLGKAKKDNKK
jgi:hypothetical protein